MDILTGTEYLKCEIACKADKAFEKATWKDRIDYHDSLDLSNARLYKKASNPVALRAAVKAMDDTIAGDETGYMISLDACSSGLQILSLLVSCPKSFDLCGGDQTKCVDSYTTIYDGMNLHGALTRKEVKNAIMTAFYGSESQPRDTFKQNLELFYDTIEKMAPGAWDLNIGLQELWDEVQGHQYEWMMPDNFHACIETQDRDKLMFKFLNTSYELPVNIDGRPEFHKGLGPNLIHSVDGMIVREMLRRCSYDKATYTRVVMALKSTNKLTISPKSPMVMILWDHYKETGFLSVRILDYLDDDTMGLVDPMVIAKLLKTLPNEPFDLVTVHDCFRCHPNHGNDVRIQYNTIMADINDSTLLTSMCSQVAKRTMKARKVGKIARQDILDGNYLLA